MEQAYHQSKIFDRISFSEKEVKDREFEKCTFQQCDLSNSNFSGNRFSDCLFIDCNLSMLKLLGCRMGNIVFKNTKVMGVNFSECDNFLFSVRFENCVADYTSFMNKKMPKTIFINTSLKHVNFANAILNQSVFDNTDLLEALFERTQLNEADFRTANNYIIDPEQNSIKKAKFSAHGLIGLLAKYDLRIE